jgi:hypothetical protein
LGSHAFTILKGMGWIGQVYVLRPYVAGGVLNRRERGLPTYMLGMAFYDSIFIGLFKGGIDTKIAERAALFVQNYSSWL